MIITKSIAEKYAKRLIESYQAKLPIRNILLEITKRYNRVFCEAKNYTPEQADAFVKQEEPKFYQALRRNQNALITSPKIGGNYGPYIKGIVNLILQFIANNLPENPDDFTHVGTFNLGKELNTEVEKEKSTVANPNPATAPSAVAESYNRPISFKNYLINDEINEQVKQSILRKVFNENNLPDELLNEIIGSLYRGIFGSKPKRIAATHDQKITATFGNAEAIKEKLNDIFNSLIKGLMAGKGNLQKFGKPMSMIMPQIIQGLENEFNKSKSDPLQYMKTIIPEKSFVKSTDTKKSFIGSLFGYQSQAEQAALAIAKQKHNKFIAFMEMLNIDPNSLGQMTLIEFKNKIKENINRLQNNRKQAFYSFMDEYKKQIDNVFKVIKPDEKKETSNKIKEITTQSDNEKVTTVLGKLGGSFKTYGLGMLAALIFSMVMTGVSHHGMNADAEGKGFKPTAGQLDKKVGGGPDTTGQGDRLTQHLDSLADQLQELSPGFEKEMAEPGNILKNLIDKAYGAGHTSPEELAELLEQNPNLAEFLDGLNFNDLRDVENALNKAYELNLNANQLKALTQKLDDIANKPAKTTSGQFGDYSKAKDSGQAPTQAPKSAAAPQIAKKGPIGTAGQILFGAKDINTGKKVTPGVAGRLHGEPVPAVKPVKVKQDKPGFFQRLFGGGNSR